MKSAWRDIIDDPLRDGTAIMSWDGKDQMPVVWCSCNKEWRTAYDHTGWTNITHWKPMDDPPP